MTSRACAAGTSQVLKGKQIGQTKNWKFFLSLIGLGSSFNERPIHNGDEFRG